MEIIDKRDGKQAFELEPGDLFEYEGGFYLKTIRDTEVVNINTGEVVRIRQATTIKKLDGRLVINGWRLYCAKERRSKLDKLDSLWRESCRG